MNVKRTLIIVTSIIQGGIVMPTTNNGRQLTRADFLNALQVGKVDTGSGTLFGVPQRRDVQTNRLTLVISTGGSGKSAIQKAINIAKQKLKVNYSSFVKFLVIDSAKDEIDALRKAGIDVLNISCPQISERLRPENRSPFYRKMISKDFNYWDIDEDGAGQQRMYGKVKLYDKNGGTTNDKLLADKIKGYFDGDWSANKDLPVDIMILTGISGGNGSGTFIDLAVRAKKACYRPLNVKVYGYIMLPDTAEGFANSETQRKSLYSNGFAALKELESYEALAIEALRHEIMPSSNDEDKVILDSSNKPFDYPVLLSGDYYEAVGMIAETIVNSVADNGGGFNQASFYSNRPRARTNKLAIESVSRHKILKPNACPEDSHMYCSIGYAHASIPEKIVIPHVVGTVCKRLYEPATDIPVGAAASVATTTFCTKEKALNKLDYERAMRGLLGLQKGEELRKDSLWIKLNRKMIQYCKPGDNPVNITFKQIAKDETGAYVKGFQKTRVINDAIEKMQTEVVDTFNDIKAKAQGIMVQYGPRAMQYLYDGVGNLDSHGKREDYSENSLRTQIEYVKNMFMDQKAGVMPRTPDVKGPIGVVWESLMKTETDSWIQDARKCVTADIRHGVAEKMKGDTGVWQTLFVAPMDDFLWKTNRFADVLETISEYYEGIGKSLDTDSYEEFTRQSGEANGINLCRDAGMYTWVRGKINNKLANINTLNVRSMLIKDFYAYDAEWTSNEEGVARKRFDELMSDACKVGKHAGANNGMDLTITDYFSHLIGSVSAASEQQTEINNAVNLIFEQLKTKSKPCLNVRDGAEQVCQMTVMLPKSLQAGNSGQMIENAFKNKLQEANNGENADPVYSSVVDSIVCYQVSVADTLSDIADMTKWENAYEQANGDTTHLNNGELPVLHMNTGYSQFRELTMKETLREKPSTEDRSVYPAIAGDSTIQDAEMYLNDLYGTGLSWLHYPSVNVARYGNSFENNENTIEASYRRDVFSKKIEEAIRLKVIECEKNGNVYKYFINLIPNDWKNISADDIRNYRTKDSQGIHERGNSLFNHLAGRNRQFTQTYRYQIYLQDTPFFGIDGFDFSEIIEAEHWTQERIDREHKAYLMRMMRKSTGLYQAMEDTLWKLYPIELELENRDKNAIEQILYREFLEMYMYGLISTDDKGLEWTVIVDENGSIERLVKFSNIMLRKLNETDKRLVMDKLRLFLVFKGYKEVREKNELTKVKIDKIQDKITKRISEETQEKMLEERLEKLNDEYAVYNEKFGSEDDPLDAIVDAYGIEEYQIEEVEPVIDFYETLKKVLAEQTIF